MLYQLELWIQEMLRPTSVDLRRGSCELLTRDHRSAAYVMKHTFDQSAMYGQ